MEEDFPDSYVGEILDTRFIPFFKVNRIEDRLVSGTIFLAKLVADSNNVELSRIKFPVAGKATTSGTPVEEQVQTVGNLFNIIVFCFLAIFVIALVRSFFSPGSSGGSSRRSRSSGSSSRSLSSRSFGGGSSGGGGISRSW